MFNVFKKKKKAVIPKLVFKNAEAAFNMYSLFGDNELKLNHPLTAIVLNAKEEGWANEPIQQRPDGREAALLKVVSNSDNDYFYTVASTMYKGEKLAVGDLVLWVPMIHEKEPSHENLRWIGMIVAKLGLEQDVATGQLNILYSYQTNI